MPGQRPTFEEARKKWRRFPQTKKTVQQKWDESVPLERAERHALGLPNGFRTAERILTCDMPVNRATMRVVAPPKKEKRPPNSVSVYLIRFRSKINPWLTFLKIGISNSVGQRFGFDVHRYSIEVIGRVGGMTRRQALHVEGRLHRMFDDARHDPKMRLLSKGNTECFEDHQGIVDRTMQLLSILRKEIERIEALNKNAGIAQR